MFNKVFRKKKTGSSYLLIMSSIREDEIDETRTQEWENSVSEDDSDFLCMFQNRHFLLSILNKLDQAGWLRDKDHERYCILRMRGHTNLNGLFTAINDLTKEFQFLCGVDAQMMHLIQQQCLKTVFFLDDPVSIASKIVEFNKKNGFKTEEQLRDFIEATRFVNNTSIAGLAEEPSGTTFSPLYTCV